MRGGGSILAYEPFIWRSSTRVQFVISITCIFQHWERLDGFFFFPGGRARAAYVQRRHATATRKLKVPQNSDAAYTILLTFPMQARIRAHVYLLWLWPYRGRGSCHPRDPPDFEQLAFNPHRISCPLLRERIASIVAPPNCAAVLIRWKKKYILLLIAIIISR